jgi:hypothetical protein
MGWPGCRPEVFRWSSTVEFVSTDGDGITDRDRRLR